MCDVQSTRRTFLRRAGVSAAVSQLAWLHAVEPQRAAQPAGDVILNSNENPYGPFPSSLREMERSASLANRYPDDHYAELWALIGKLHGAKQEEIALGCGSTDILRMAAQAFCTRAKTIVQAGPTFLALSMYGRRFGAETINAPLRADYAHDLDAMLTKSTPAPDIAYICNPNNPTGSLTPRAEIERFISKLPRETYVLIDEAYHHFAEGAAGYRSFADHRLDDERVIVARTFSKIYGLAGLRIGYAIGAAKTIAALQSHHVLDNPNVIAVRAAIASLADNATLALAVRRNAADRDEFVRQATARKLRTIPSFANFVMLETGKPIAQVREYFRAQRLHIGRPFPPYDTFARISLGLPEEMRAFWKVWDARQ